MKQFLYENESSVSGSLSLRSQPAAIGQEAENQSAIGAVGVCPPDPGLPGDGMVIDDLRVE